MNITTSIKDLSEELEFTDVTLACGDGQQVQAHKVILASSSIFFRNILKNNKHAHPLIYMRGLTMKDLSSIMSFIYCGEASIFQDDLQDFLSLADDLQLKGLLYAKNNLNETANTAEKFNLTEDISQIYET